MQGHDKDGYRRSYEHHILIIAFIYGSKPMASGVNNVFLKTLFLHTSPPYLS